MFESGLAITVAGVFIAVVLGGIGSAVGVSTAGQAGAGVISEKPELFGKVLVLKALPGTQGIYGFLAGLLVLIQVGLLGGEAATVSVSTAWQLFFACMPVGFTCLVSGIQQGKATAAGLQAVAKDPSNVGKAIIMSAMVETYAVLGLLITILLLFGIEIA